LVVDQIPPADGADDGIVLDFLSAVGTFHNKALLPWYTPFSFVCSVTDTGPW
jgi:hypothetical protein